LEWEYDSPEYRHLVHRDAIGWVCGKQVVRKLTSHEYDVLVSLLEHHKTRLRWSAADLLGKIGNRCAVRPLIQALQDPHWLVRLHAAKALGRIGDPAAISHLVTAMSDPSPYVRRRVVTALAALNKDRNSEIFQLLIASLSDSDKNVRARAAQSLGKAAYPLAVSALAAAVLDENDNVSWRAVSALESIGSPAVDALIGLLDHPDRDVQYRAIKTLGRIGNRRATRSIKTFLKHPDIKLQRRARFALDQIQFWKR
jgi:HEAT repeat protein